MTYLKKGIFIIIGLLLFFLSVALYFHIKDGRIRKNLKFVLATVYSVDNNVKYRHYRIKFYYTFDAIHIDSSSSFRDDLTPQCFAGLEGKLITLAIDSTNRRNNYLLITKKDFEKFDIKNNSFFLFDTIPVCD